MNISSSLKTVSNAVTSKAGRQILLTQKHSPTILFGAGVVGVVATAVMASKATLALDEVMTEHENTKDRAQAMLARVPDRYTAKDYTQDMAKLKTKTIIKVGKLYAPAVLIGVGSICALTGSHIILTRRYQGAVAAFVALDKSMSQYQARVRDLIGEEKERELRFDTQTREIAVDTENGVEVQSVTEAVGSLSPYARLWAKDTSSLWSEEPSYNLVTLRTQQTYCNDRLRSRGHIFLNEVYDCLGLEHSKIGAVTGWVYEKGSGDNYVDFGMWDGQDMMSFHQFLTQKDGAIWLDFNVDGHILDLIEKKGRR